MDRSLQGLQIKLILVSTMVFLFLSCIAIFPLGASAAEWFDSGWQYRKEITVKSSQVPGDLTNFPMLISITDSDISAKSQADGDDILFTTSDGTTQISHEIEKYVTATGELIVWAKAPSLTSSADTVFYMYYGNSGAANQEDAENVWDSDFLAVYHLGGNSWASSQPKALDSTINSNDGTDTDTTDTPGLVGSGRDFDGTDDSIRIPNGASLKGQTKFTIELTFNPDVLNNQLQILWSESTSASTEFVRAWVAIDSNNKLRFGVRDDDSQPLNVLRSVTALTVGTTYTISAVYDTATDEHYMFLNDSSETTTAALDALDNADPAGIRMGEFTNDLYEFDGMMDEVRISKTIQ